jgi:ribonuclease J
MNNTNNSGHSSSVNSTSTPQSGQKPQRTAYIARPRSNKQNRNQGQRQNNRNRNNKFGKRNFRSSNRNNANTTIDFNNGVKRQRFPSEIIHTANALEWNNYQNYQFRDYSGSKLRLIPISGVQMIGTNCTVLEYENDIMIIDAGLGFPEIDQMGVDALVPNLSYLHDKLDKIRGLVITHGHTDHIGGLHHIYEKIGFPPIYAPRLAAEMIREKFKETSFGNRARINEIDGNSSYYLGKFHLSHFRMNHTIMDNYGICIDTPVGRIVTPSDYKFDLNPYKESPSDYSKLAKLGDEGVLLLLDESTNVKRKGWGPSESAIAKDLEDTIREAHGRLFIGMFSTMISRIRQIIEISARHNKKVALMGRSLTTNAKISHKLGYIDVSSSTFIEINDISKYPDDQVVILTTGSQGEPNAALMRMAQDEDTRIKFKRTDTVVFSSSRIPGNEARIDKLINMIAEKGCRILTNDHLTLHVSGHGCEEDHKLMLQLIKPKFLMPIHGEPSMLEANKELAMKQGMKPENVIITRNGAVVELWPDGWQIKEEVESDPIWVVGDRVGNFSPEITKERKALSTDGVLIINLSKGSKDQITIEDIDVFSKGFFVQTTDTFIKSDLPRILVEQVNNMKDKDRETIKSIITKITEREIENKYDRKKPLICVSVL